MEYIERKARRGTGAGQSARAVLPPHGPQHVGDLADRRARPHRVYDQRQETRLDTAVVVEFMNKNSQRIGVLTADSAVVDDKTRNMVAYGNVKVVSDSTHTTLQTPVLMWNNKTQKLYTTEKIHIKSPTEIIDGTGMESDQYLKNYKIFKVSGIKNP